MKIWQQMSQVKDSMEIVRSTCKKLWCHCVMSLNSMYWERLGDSGFLPHLLLSFSSSIGQTLWWIWNMLCWQVLTLCSVVLSWSKSKGFCELEIQTSLLESVVRYLLSYCAIVWCSMEARVNKHRLPLLAERVDTWGSEQEMPERTDWVPASPRCTPAGTGMGASPTTQLATSSCPTPATAPIAMSKAGRLMVETTEKKSHKCCLGTSPSHAVCPPPPPPQQEEQAGMVHAYVGRKLWKRHIFRVFQSFFTLSGYRICDATFSRCGQFQ